MNEKFYNLSKEKQDRMINAAIKVFAQNGYLRASTDAMIKEAEVSKGLLFHYFESKKGLYTFVLEYCARYMMMELGAGMNDSEKNLFDRLIMAEECKIRMLKNYPYLDLFLISIQGESDDEASEEAKRWSDELEENYKKLINEKSDPALLRGNLTIEEARDIVSLTMEGYKMKTYRSGMAPEDVLKGFIPYLDVLRNNMTR